MKKIYVVTAGEYSDYRIQAVFSEKEIAEKYVKLFKKDSDFRVEEHDLNPDKEGISNGYNPFYVIMTREGECVSVNKDLSCYFDHGSINVGWDGNLEVSLFAKDKKHAIKIANEKRLQVIAGNHWTPRNFNIKL